MSGSPIPPNPRDAADRPARLITLADLLADVQISLDSHPSIETKDCPSGPASSTSLASGSEDQVVTWIADDSRTVIDGSLFLARQPQYIEAAVAAGATSIALDRQHFESPSFADQREALAQKGIAQIVAEQVDQRFAAKLAALFYGHPARNLRLVGITGTNGKTTTALIIRHLLTQAACPSGIVGTIAIDTGAPTGPQPAELTTPGAVEVQRLWSEMVCHAQTACVMEVSSHGLEQGRVESNDFEVAVFTNLTQDHLDYHGTMDAYAAAKARLFADLPAHGVAVVNAADPAHRIMLERCSAKVMACHFGTFDQAGHHHPPNQPGANKSNAWLESVQLAADHSQAILVGPWGQASVRFPMVGGFNLANALQAACAAYAIAPFDAAQLAERLAATPAIPGRLEPIPNARFPMDIQVNGPQPWPSVLVDYAHTPDAVQRVLQAIKPLTTGSLIAMIGCGGDRDASKRPRMLEATYALANHVVITSDNPRSEDPMAIINDMLGGWPGGAAVARSDPRISIEVDRAKAINAAVQMGSSVDTILLCGKGHEPYQIIGQTTIDFDDRLHALAALRSIHPESGPKSK